VLVRVKFVSVLICFFILLFFSVFWSGLVLGYAEDEAREKIELAESEVLSCYSAVFEAEKAGANVSGLLVVLNEAGGFLSMAKFAYQGGDFDSAFNNASLCLSRLAGFVDHADVLRVEAEQAAYYDFMVNFVGSGVGALCVVVCGFVVWKILGKGGKAGERVN